MVDMTDAELEKLLKKMKANSKKELQSPKAAKKFLTKIGVINKNGKLRKEYQ